MASIFNASDRNLSGYYVGKESIFLRYLPNEMCGNMSGFVKEMVYSTGGNFRRLGNSTENSTENSPLSGNSTFLPVGGYKSKAKIKGRRLVG